MAFSTILIFLIVFGLGVGLISRKAPDAVNRDFTPRERLDLTWCGDLTEIPTDEGKFYLAAILDLYSRAIVGWAMSKRLDSQLAIDALVMALAKRGTAPKLLHSDQGSTYATAAYRDLLKRHAIRQSMSRKGNCWDTLRWRASSTP